MSTLRYYVMYASNSEDAYDLTFSIGKLFRLQNGCLLRVSIYMSYC